MFLWLFLLLLRSVLYGTGEHNSPIKQVLVWSVNKYSWCKQHVQIFLGIHVLISLKCPKINQLGNKAKCILRFFLNGQTIFQMIILLSIMNNHIFLIFLPALDTTTTPLI